MLANLLGHDDVTDRFRRSIGAGRLASTFLFVGPEGVGKRSYAIALAQALLCLRPAEDDPLRACGQCESCQLMAAGTHPDLLNIARPEGKSFIPVELLIGSQERRMREGLCHDIGLKPFLGGRKIAIIDDADYLNQEGANALLKTLEEPPPRCLIILIGTSAARQLPTIRSRCQIVRFAPLPHETLVELLLRGQIAPGEREAKELADLADGSLAKAIELSDVALRTFRGQLFDLLSAGTVDSLRLAAEIGQLVESAGKEASAKRERLRLVIDMAVLFYRTLMLAAERIEPAGDATLLRYVNRAAATGYPSELAAAQLARCLEALEELSRNANTSTLLACWLDDLEGLQLAPRP